MDRVPSEVDPEVLRQAMRQWATGVTVVTSVHQGVQHGMTVSAFTSITLSPPLVLVSLEIGTRTCTLVKKSGVYGVTILDRQQEEISNRFAGRSSEYQDRFHGLETYTLVTGAPLLEQGLASFDCNVVAAYELGDHMLYIGDVVGAQISGSHQPLIYYQRTYHHLKNEWKGR